MSDRKSSDSSSTDKPQKPSPFKPSAFGANKSVFGGQQITPAFGNFNPAKTSRIDNLASVLAKKKKLENKIKKDASKNKSSEDFGEYSNIPKAFRPPSANSGNRSRSNSINTSINNDKCLIEIKDNGIGIKDDDQKKLFTKFYRVHTGNVHDVKGFGLGLFYVKNICDKQNWDLNLNSKLGLGTEIKISIPIVNQ